MAYIICTNCLSRGCVTTDVKYDIYINECKICKGGEE